MLIIRDRGHVFLNFLSPRIVLLTPETPRGEDTRCWLAEHAISTFVFFFFLCFVAFKYLKRIFCATTLRTSSAAKLEGSLFGWKTENRSWRPSAFTSIRLLPTNYNRTWQCSFDGRKEQVKLTGWNYIASSFFVSNVCYLYRSMLVLFQSGGNLHSSGEIDAKHLV